MRKLTKIVAGIALAGALVAGGAYVKHRADEYDKNMKEGLFFYEATPQIIEKEVENTIRQSTYSESHEEKPY